MTRFPRIGGGKGEGGARLPGGTEGLWSPQRHVLVLRLDLPQPTPQSRPMLHRTMAILEPERLRLAECFATDVAMY